MLLIGQFDSSFANEGGRLEVRELLLPAVGPERTRGLAICGFAVGAMEKAVSLPELSAGLSIDLLRAVQRSLEASQPFREIWQPFDIPQPSG